MRFSRIRLGTLLTACIFPLWIAPAFGATGLLCHVETAEKEVFASFLRNEYGISAREPLVIEDSTDRSHFAREFLLSDLVLRGLASALYPQLRSAPKGSVTVFDSVPLGLFIPGGRTIGELQDDYNKKLEDSCQVDPLPYPSANVKLVSHSDLRRIFHRDDPADGWREFRNRFSEDAVLLSFSRVAFDKGRKVAMVHVSRAAGSMAAHGTLYLLRRDGKAWRIVSSYPTWTT